MFYSHVWPSTPKSPKLLLREGFNTSRKLGGKGGGKKEQKDEMKEKWEEVGEKLYFQQVSRVQESIDTKTAM